MTKSFRYCILSCIMFACIAVLSSCTKNNRDTTSSSKALIMAFNLAPDKTSVGFSVSGKVFTTAPLTYANYTGSYLSVDPGDKSLEAFDYTSSNGIFAITSASLKASNFYSAFLVGRGGHYQNIVVNDNIDSLSGSSGLAYVRYLDAIADSMYALNVVVATGGGTIIDESAPFPTLSAFKGVTPGNITVNVTNANGIALTKTITVEAKKVYTILLVGVQNSSTAPLQINSITNGTLN